MAFRLKVVIPFLLVCTGIFSQDDNAPIFGKGLFNLKGKEDSWSMKIGFRMQFLASNSWLEQDNDDGFLLEPNTNFLVRRSRLKFDGFAFSPKLQYKFELGLSNRDMSGTSIFTGNRFLDTIWGACFGSILAGHPINSYVIGDEFLENGISLYAVTALIVTWVSVGVMHLPAEIAALGRKFAVLRNTLSFLLSIPVAIAAVFLVNLIGE